MAITYSEIGASNGQPRTSTQGADWRRTYTRHWQAETDDPLIGAKAVREACPVAIGQTYAADGEADTGSFCQQISVTEDTTAGDGRRWIVTAEYGPLNILESSPQMPLTQRPRLSFGWAEFQVPQVKSALGNPIANSAGDYFDPPIMMDDAWPIMVITRNEPGFNLNLVAECKGKINEAPWFGFPAKWWKCLNITSDEAQDPDGAIYFVMTYEFALNPNEWVEEVLDVGFNEINASGKKVKITDDKGSPVSSPWPLNEDGTKKAAGEEAEFITFETHEAIDFSIFNLDSFYAEEVAAGRLI